MGLSVMGKTSEINDRVRKNLGGDNSIIVFSRSLAFLPGEQREAVIAAIRDFDDFTPDNDQYDEHDLIVVDVEGIGTVYAKFDYYARDMMTMSDDPADTEKTVRVLTIFPADEY